MSEDLPANQPVKAQNSPTVAAEKPLAPRRRRWALWLGVLGLIVGSIIYWQTRGPSVKDIESEVRDLGGWAETEAICPASILDRLPNSWATAVGQWRHISVIYVNGRSVTDAHLLRWGRLRGLRRLGLSSTQVTDAGLVHLSGLTHLEWLYLDSTAVTHAGLVHISGLTNIEMLSLNSTSVTDAGLVHLSGLQNLERLNLDSTQVTDAGLVHLSELTNLEWLQLHFTPVSDAAKAEFNRQHRHCSVY